MVFLLSHPCIFIFILICNINLVGIFDSVPECHGEPPYLLRFAGWYDDLAVRADDGQWRFARRAIWLWDDLVLANFPGHCQSVPRKRPSELRQS